MLSYLSYLGFLAATLSLSLAGQVSQVHIPEQIILTSLETSNYRQIRSLFIAQIQIDSNRQTEADRLLQRGSQQFNRSQYKEALESYQQVLAIQRELDNKAGIGETTYRIGFTYRHLGQYPQALEFYQQSLTIRQQLGDRKGIGETLNGIGYMYSLQGQYDKALELLQQALTIRQEIGDRAGVAGTFNNIGIVYDKLSKYAQALEFYRQSLAVRREVGDKEGERRTLNNIGLIYTALGQNLQAIEFYQQALAINRDIGDRYGEVKNIHNIGWAYERLGQYSKSLEFYQQALIIRREINDRPGLGKTLNSMGDVYEKLGQYPQAIEVLEKALVIVREIGDRAGIGKTLDSFGKVYKALGQYSQALDSYQQALAIIKEVGDRRVEGIILSNIGDALAEQKKPELAIAFYKQSVNVTESIRSQLGSLPLEQQRSYTATIADTYRRLADLLLQEDRVLEAIQVLDLLKIQEIDDFLKNVRGNQQTAIGIGLNDIERQINDILSANLNRERQRAFDELINSREVNELVEKLRRSPQQPVTLSANFNNLQTKLQQLESKAVIFYPLILADRLELVLITPNAPPLHRKVAVKREELNKEIVQFLADLKNPDSNPKPRARQLYNLLIKPIEKELQQAEAKTIIYAPDRQLRYLPLTTLFDGRQWLAQRYRVNNITAISLTDIETKPLNQPRILAAAATRRSIFTVGLTSYSLPGLRYAGNEVENLAAIMPVTIKLLGDEFSRASIMSGLPNSTLLHLATHAKFVPGNPEDSFILLGKEDYITLREVEDLKLPNVDLVVLSACETGVGDELGNGEEILGFGYQIQQAGAKAAIASLWKVNDGGTQALMTAFYAALQSGTFTKTEALQKAQIMLISGDDSVLGETEARSLQQRTRNNLPPAVSSRLSHPYYWAPFILIGNGL